MLKIVYEQKICSPMLQVPYQHLGMVSSFLCNNLLAPLTMPAEDVYTVWLLCTGLVYLVEFFISDVRPFSASCDGLECLFNLLGRIDILCFSTYHKSHELLCWNVTSSKQQQIQYITGLWQLWPIPVGIHCIKNGFKLWVSLSFLQQGKVIP